MRSLDLPLQIPFEIPLIFPAVRLQPFTAAALEPCDLWTIDKEGFT